MSPIATMLTALLALAASLSFSARATAEGPADLGCSLEFSLSGWSAPLRHSEGSGIISCEKGGVLRVRIVATGAGLASGKAHIDGATGIFTDVHSIHEILGAYTQVSGAAHAPPGNAQVLGKGGVLLALSGRAKGIDLGAGIGEFVITRGD